jgi:hypothetical protein
MPITALRRIIPKASLGTKRERKMEHNASRLMVATVAAALLCTAVAHGAEPASQTCDWRCHG